MKYINPYYLWFDVCSTDKYSGKESGFLSTNGHNTKYLDGGTRIKVSFDAMLKYTSGNYLFQAYFSDSPLAAGLSTVQIYIDNYINIRTNDQKRTGSVFPIDKTKWYHLYCDIDTVKGIVVLYVDGSEVCRYESYVQSGVTLKTIKFCPFYSSSSTYIGIKNIIVTDGELSQGETVKEIDATVIRGDWEETDGIYSTDVVGRQMTICPVAKTVEGYNITGAALLFKSGVASDGISAVNVVLGEKSERVALPAVEGTFGIVFDGVNSVDDMTIVSSE